MRSSLEIQMDKPGTQGLRGRRATFSDGARVSTESLQSPSPPHSPIKTNLKGKNKKMKKKKRRKILAGLILVKSRRQSSEQYDQTITYLGT